MFGRRYFGSKHFGRRYWGKGPTASAGPIRILAAVAIALESKIPSMAGKIWCDQTPAAIDPPRIALFSLGGRHSARGKVSRIETHQFQVTIEHHDPDLIDELTENVIGALDYGSITIAQGPRKQRFFQMNLIESPRTLPIRRERGELLHTRVVDLEAGATITIVAKQQG